MTQRYTPPPEVQKAANARAALRERSNGRTMTRDERRLNQRYTSVLDPFNALTREERIERYGIDDYGQQAEHYSIPAATEDDRAPTGVQRLSVDERLAEAQRWITAHEQECDNTIPLDS